MADDRVWLGRAAAVRNVETIQITADDAATTYKVTIHGIEVSVTGSGTGVNATATKLQAALDAETHRYFKFYVWTVATDTVTATCTVSGAELVITATATDGTGTLSQAVTAAATGPHHFNNADNWSGSAVPVSTDRVVFRDSAVPCLYALDQSGLTGCALEVWDSYTGRIGLRPDGMAITADGASVDAAATEPRDLELYIGCTRVELGMRHRPQIGGNAGLINLRNAEAGASDCIVHATTAAPAVTGLPSVHYRAAHANADLEVRSVNAGIGLCTLQDDHTGTLGDISFTGAAGVLLLGRGVTYTNLDLQAGGPHIVDAAAVTVTSIKVHANAQAIIQGRAWKVTALDVWGVVTDRHDDLGGGTAAGTVNVYDGGKLDARGGLARTYDALVLDNGGELLKGPELTITTLTLPSEPTSLKAAVPA